MQSLSWNSENSVLLSAMIHTPFKNEESSTPKLISSLDRATFSMHFQNEYYLAYSLLILSSKRSISNGIEWKTNPESFKTSQLNSTGTISRSEIARVM